MIAATSQQYPLRMAAMGVTAADVAGALTANNYLAAVGQSKNDMVTVPLNANTSLHSVDEFKQLAIKSAGGAIVRPSPFFSSQQPWWSATSEDAPPPRAEVTDPTGPAK